MGERNKRKMELNLTGSLSKMKGVARGGKQNKERSVILSSPPLRLVVPAWAGIQDSHPLISRLVSPSYGDSVVDSKGRRVHWRAVQRCTEIVQSWCDLSKEMWDLEQGYYARVRAVSGRASSKWALTQRFDPKSDSKFR